MSPRRLAYSKRELKRLLRHAERQRPVRKYRPRRAGGTEPGGEWTLEEMRLLGTMPDEALAKKIGRTRAAVQAYRIKCGLAKADRKVIPWTPKEDALVRRLPLREVSRLTGRTLASVEARRKRLGLPPRRLKPWNPAGPAAASNREDAYWSKEEEALLGRLPDAQLALKLGRSIEAVRGRRQDKRIRIRKQWRPENDKLLGTMRDAEIAMRLGWTTPIVSQRRHQLGIPSPEEKQAASLAAKLEALSDREIARLVRQSHRLRPRPLARPRAAAPHWTPAEERLLGKWPDKKLAAFLGRTLKGVEARRLKLGIRFASPGRPWTAEERRLLDPALVRGPLRKSTSQLARQLGRSVVAVSIQRRLRYGTVVRQRPWTLREVRLLGTRRDREIAALIGRKCGTVQVKRGFLGIPSFRARQKFRWTPAKDRLLGTHSDVAIGRRLGCPDYTVKARRHGLGILAGAARPWTPAQERLVGTMGDEEVARRIGRTRKAVQHRRLALTAAGKLGKLPVRSKRQAHDIPPAKRSG